MPTYLVDIRNITGVLKGNARKAFSQYPELEGRLLFDLRNIPSRIINESSVRLFWNEFNHLSRFPHEKWDENSAIRTWFSGYDPEHIEILADGETEISDRGSDIFFSEVVDPTICYIREYIYQLDIRGNWEWTEFRIKEVMVDSILIEDMGDFRIRDWERMKRQYESDGVRKGNDIYSLYAPRHH